MIYLDHYPALCQSAMAATAAVTMDATTCPAAAEQTFWDAYAWPIATVAGGLIAGGIIGYKLH